MHEWRGKSRVGRYSARETTYVLVLGVLFMSGLAVWSTQLMDDPLADMGMYVCALRGIVGDQRLEKSPWGKG